MKKIIVLISIVLLSVYIIFSFLKYKKTYDDNSITFASWGSQSEIIVINKVIKNFEEKNDIKVNFIHIPQNYFQKIHLLFASNLQPDVVFINNQNIPLYIKANLLEDLTTYFPNTNNEYYEEAINCFKNGNGLYAIPRDISNLVLYYNKSIFNEHNIKFPDEIKSIQELKELAQKVTTKGSWGINYEEDTLFWVYYLASNGGGILSDDKKALLINNKESIEALNLYSDFINKYHIVPNKAEIGSMTTAQMFINGKIAIYLGGRWLFPKFNETINFDWGVTEFPANEKNKVYIDSSGWAISKKSKNKEKAVELIKYLSSYETTNQFVQSGLIVPARKDSAKIFVEKEQKNKTFIKMLKNSKPTPVNENYSKINDILKEKSQIIFNANQKAEIVLDSKTIRELESLL